MASANRQPSDDGRIERIVSYDDERLSALIADDDVAILATLDRDAERDKLVDSFGELSRSIIELLNRRERDLWIEEERERLISDGGVDEPDPIGLGSSSTVDVEPFAEDLEIGSRVRYKTPRGVLEGEVVGFSTWDQHFGKPVVRKPPELEDALDADLVVLREEDLVDEEEVEDPEIATDGGRVVEEREPCSSCGDRPAAVGEVCLPCHRENVDGVATDGGVARPDPVEELGLPPEIAAYVPDRDVSLKAKEILEDLQLGRPRVKRVLEVAYGSRRPRDLDPEDLLSTLEHSGGRLALISAGNTGVTVFNWIGGDRDPFAVWTYSAIDDALDNDAVGRIETYPEDVKARIRYAGPSVVERTETPLADEGST